LYKKDNLVIYKAQVAIWEILVEAASSRGIWIRGWKPLPHSFYLLFIDNQKILLWVCLDSQVPIDIKARNRQLEIALLDFNLNDIVLI